MTQTLFNIQDLNLAYAQQEVVTQLNLRIPKGQVLTVIGENGSGKSTLLNALSGLIKPSQGVILLNDQNIQTQSAQYLARQITSIGQSDVNIADMPVWTRIAQGYIPQLGATFYPGPQEQQAIKDLAKDLELEDCLERTLGQLSGGERRRVHLARALIHPSSKVMILDEPFANVDIGHQPVILKVLRERINAGHTLICALQQLHLVFELGGMALGLKKGKKVVFEEPVRALQENNLKLLFNRKGRLHRSDDHFHGVLFESQK